ncbi:MAG: hypothetical protein HYS21_01685 [Deltaproteobacteria bacterium]|nr:hypothetical protein [Deltaproteobacteria bacterium]
MAGEEEERFSVNQAGLPDLYPTHRHDAMFWEALGRTVATFGFLEDRAIFAFTATKPYREEEIQKACDEWLQKLERALTDQLGGLIDGYGKAVREHPSATISNLDELLEELRKASEIRNVLCHGSWHTPDVNGASLPFFVNRKKEQFDTAIDVDFLRQVQRHTVDLIREIINSVTHMGWQFPGSGGPGRAIWHIR